MPRIAPTSAPADHAIDTLFHALSDTTRRDILRRCIEGNASVSLIASAYPMSFAAVQKHVAVLERAGLVSKERQGREQIVRTELSAVRAAHDVLDHLERAWLDRVGRMSSLLAKDTGEPSTKGTTE